MATEETAALQRQVAQLQQQMQQMMLATQQAIDRAQQSEARAVSVETQLAAAVAAKPVDPPAPRAEIVDTRLLSKPKNFSGRLEEWAP